MLIILKVSINFVNHICQCCRTLVVIPSIHLHPVSCEPAAHLLIVGEGKEIKQTVQGQATVYQKRMRIDCSSADFIAKLDSPAPDALLAMAAFIVLRTIITLNLWGREWEEMFLG
jgi:hypothetical protein